MNALPGHALRREGAVAYLADGRDAGVFPPSVQLHAACECGELSDPGISRNAAKRWHRVHKDQLRRAQEEQ